VHIKCQSNQSLFTQLSLHSLTVILIFTVFYHIFFEVHYRTKAVVCQNVLKAAVQCTAVKPMEYFVIAVKELTQDTA
jgi:uncharacterized membrane protein YesL